MLRLVPGWALRVVALLTSLGTAASAQSVSVTVTQGGSGAPLYGAFVSVLDANGTVLQSGLTSESGVALFRMAGGTSVRVRAEMIGHASQVSERLALRTGETHRIRLMLPVQAFRLTEIRVEADQQCRLRPDAALEVGRVWEFARTALGIHSWTERQQAYRLSVSTWERDLDSSGRKVERESRRDRTRLTRAPFTGLPADELINGGFTRSHDDGSIEWFGPDAALLLSDAFMDTHCFRLTRSPDEPNSIGLAFVPAVRTERTDIEGTLWLDEQTGRLRHLEYHYTSLPYAEARGLARGRLDFEAMPDGAWIIRRWWIRVPVLGRDQSRAGRDDGGIRVIAMRETGGEVTSAASVAGRAASDPQRGSLAGIVWDSIRSAPLAGARVQLSGTAHAATSDTAGRFTITGVAPGVFSANFTHPELDSLGVAPPAVEVEITAGSTADIALAIPSPATVLLSACAAERVDPDGGQFAALTGTVADGVRGEPIPGAAVRVEWQDVTRVQPPLQVTDRWFEVRTDARGRYTACGIPVDKAVTVRASMLMYRSNAERVTFARPEHRSVNLAITLPANVAAASAVGAGRGEHLTQGTQGLLIDAATEAPVRNAEVALRRATGETVASTTTDQRGGFRLHAPVPGRYVVDARALGYRPLVRDSIDIASGILAVLEIRMVPDALALDPLIVTTEQRAMHLDVEGFYRRRDTGLGVFITPETIEKRRPVRMSDMLFGVPGINIAETTSAGRGSAVYFRSGVRPGGVCWPMVYLNRQLVSTGGTSDVQPDALDILVSTRDVAALEVFRSPAEIPPEFNGPNAGCGVIVIWTRHGGGD